MPQFHSTGLRHFLFYYGVNMPKVECTCLTCVKVFSKWPSDIKNKGGKYCSCECYYKSKIDKKRNVKVRELIINSDHALVPLTQNKFSMIDLCDFERVSQYNWCAIWRPDINTYCAQSRINGKNISLHRFILNLKDIKIKVDHIDHDELNNLRKNIRICTNQQNSMNQKPQRNCSSRFKGVSLYKSIHKWRAYIKFNGKQIHLGFYDDEINAARAYNEKAQYLFDEFAHLNHI